MHELSTLPLTDLAVTSELMKGTCVLVPGRQHPFRLPRISAPTLRTNTFKAFSAYLGTSNLSPIWLAGPSLLIEAPHVLLLGWQTHAVISLSGPFHFNELDQMLEC